MSNKINDKNSIEQEIKLSNEKLGEFLFKEETNKIKSEIKHIFNILINSESSNISANSYIYLKNIIHILDSLINKKSKDIILIIIKEIYFLLTNIKSKEILTFIFSTQNEIINEQGINMNIFDKLISINDFNKNEEFLDIQINLMKSLILKLDSESILYFYKSEINYFPILNKSLLLYDIEENMLHSVVQNILLLITKNKNKSLQEYLSSFPVALYYPIIIYNLKKIISDLNYIYIKEKNVFDYFEEKHEELYDIVLYINDILLCNINNINFILINCLLNEIIFPLFNIIISKTKENVSLISAIYVLSFFIYYIKNDFIINIISFFLLNEKIPAIFYEKIKIYKYTQLNDQFLKDINFLIKNINDADINDQMWKRNSEFIKNDIGLDLATGIMLKENNYDYFKEMIKNIKDDRCNDIDFIQNDIFLCICELMTSEDENIILNTVILFYNIINYYMNYFKNYEENNNNIEEDEEIKKNKIKNAKIRNNNLNQINKLNNKYQEIINNNKTLFNPFLLTFINFTKFNSNINNKNLLRILSNLIKKRNKFRIFTNELILNTLLLLIKIFCLEQNNFSREVYHLIKDIKLILKEDINSLKIILNEEPDNFPLIRYNEIILYINNSFYTFRKKRQL